MSAIITYILDNTQELLAAISMVIAACSAIAALTPTPVDDGVVKKLYKVVDFLALNIGRAKQK
jgi:hypothetical protein